LHYPLHVKLLGDPIQFIELEPLTSPCPSKSLERHVEADLVSESKAVSDRASNAVDANNLPFDAVLFDVDIEYGWRDVDDAQWRSY